MNQHSKKSSAAPPEAIYVIRHGEKPADPEPSGHGKSPDAPFGVDLEGNQSPHSLVPRGWQRAGGLVALFGPASGGSKAGLRTPTVLLSPVHGGPGKTAGHRTYQTIEGLGSRLGITIDSAFAVGQESRLAASVVNDHTGVVLICWEHHHIPAIASALPVVEGTAIPSAWPKHRFDVVWTFTLVPDAATTQYTFGQIPQLLLSGDSDTVIPACLRLTPCEQCRDREAEPSVFAAVVRTELLYELQRRLSGAGTTIAVAAHPGLAGTELARYTPAIAAFFYARVMSQNAEMGALPTLRAATDPGVLGGQYYGPDGFFGTRGYPKLAHSSRRSHDTAIQRRLWTVSEELTGVTFPVYPGPAESTAT